MNGSTLLPITQPSPSISALSAATAQTIATQTRQPSALTARSKDSLFHLSSINFPEAIGHFLTFVTAIS